MAYGKIKADTIVYDNSGSDVEISTAQVATTAFVAGAVPDISGKANIAAPTFTGVPAAPTAAQGTNTTQLATTAFVNAEIAAGYGDSNVDTHLNRSTAATGELLSWNGSDYDWVASAGLTNNATGTYSLGVGTDALDSETSGAQSNTAFGTSAGTAITTGSHNTAIGMRSLYTNTTGINNTAVGSGALYSNTTGNYNAATGNQALNSNTTGNYNTATGYQTLVSNTTGSSNTATGYAALYSNTTGNYNIATGYQTLYSNTTGSSNTATGYRALFSNTTGVNNAATGYQALNSNTTGNYNIATGYAALFSNTTGNYNIATGSQALNSNTTGNYNIATGYAALYSNTTGHANIGIGFLNAAGSYTPVFNPTTESNRLVLGHTAITNAYVQVAWTVTSDARDKMNFAPVPYGLDFVNQLKPTAYQFKVDRDTETPHGNVRYGFKAQDILALEGDNPVIIDTEDADKLKYKGEHLVPVLVNAVQELTVMVKELQTEIKTLKG